MKHLLLTILSVLLAIPLLAQAKNERLTITISNSSTLQQQRVVEIDLKAVSEGLGIDASAPFILRNKAGQQVDYQITHDGKLLVFAGVQPESSWTIYAEAGKPQPMKTWVCGKLYKMRKDDIAWENDRCAYRVYGPALQATGEKSYGIDVWVKNTPDLVVDYRYRLDRRGNIVSDSLKSFGRKAEADSALNAMSFHLDHGNGMDGYGVGPTLGCGAPALIEDGKMILPYCYKNYEILDNGPLRFTVRLDFGANAESVVEHRIISLDRGSHFNKITVWYDNVNKPITLCAGVVLNGGCNPVFGKNYVIYADHTDRPDVHGSEIYVAALFPYNDITTGITPDNLNAAGFITPYSGQPITYYAGAAWSMYDVPNAQIWEQIVQQSLIRYLGTPFNVSIVSQFQ